MSKDEPDILSDELGAEIFENLNSETISDEWELVDDKKLLRYSVMKIGQLLR